MTNTIKMKSMKKHIIILLTALLPFFIFAQDDIYIATEIEGGLLSTDYQSLTPSVTPSIINSENSNFNIKVSAAVVLEWDFNVLATAGISQNLRFWNIEGESNTGVLKVKQSQYFPSVFIGGWYQIPIIPELTIYTGGLFTVDFLNYNSLNDRDGSETDYVISETNASSKIGLNIVPEIGVQGKFRNGDAWQVGVKYYHPLNGDIIEGKLSQFQNGNLLEEVAYEASGQVFALSLKYFFKLRK